MAALCGAELPNVIAETERFIELLNSEPAPMSPTDHELYELNRALGVA